MLKRFTETYEVHLRRRGTWTVERVGLTAPEARELGESEFRRAGVDGLRVVRCRSSKVTGSVTEDLMLERVRTPPPPDAVIGTVDEAPVCRTIDDLLRSGSRLTVHRLFQGWLRSITSQWRERKSSQAKASRGWLLPAIRLKSLPSTTPAAPVNS